MKITIQTSRFEKFMVGFIMSIMPCIVWIIVLPPGALLLEIVVSIFVSIGGMLLMIYSFQTKVKQNEQPTNPTN